MSITLFSPAKLNLFLRILGRRGDGYHELASLFQAINFGDTLTLTLSKWDVLTSTCILIPCDDTNLIWKAVELFRERSEISFNVAIHLEKNLPIQSGLGGGSSNAATALWGLNELLGRPFSLETLIGLGAELGSDVPFFFSCGTAYCQGRGERLHNLEPLSLPSPLWIVKPQCGLSTAHIFKCLNLKECAEVSPEDLLQSFIQGRPIYHNDLEVPAFRVVPLLSELKTRLINCGYHNVMMTGSGTSFFCFGDKRPKQEAGWNIHPASFVNRQENEWYSLS